jgi:hypothetical protein
MATARIRNTHLHFDGVNYFRGKATNVQLGSSGEKKTPIAKENYLEIQANIPPKNIAKASARVIQIENESYSKLNFGTNVTALINGVPTNFSGDAAIEKLKKAELKLVLISVTMNQMKNAINKSSGILRNLKSYGGDARVAVEIFSILNANLASEITTSGSLDISADAKGIKASVNGSGSGTSKTSVVLPEGSCFAYLLAKINWKMKFLKKVEVEKLTDDQWGMS